MGLWATKYADIDDKRWLDLVLREAPPGIRREKVGGRVVTDGFAGSTGPFIVRRASVPPAALEDGPSDTPVALTRAELAPAAS